VTEAKLQPSPWGSGPFGWLGTALILLGACFWVATLLLFVWAGFQQDLRFVFLGILSFLGIFPLIAAGFFVPRAGSRRAASFQPRLATTGPKGVISAITLMILGWVLGIGGFLYVAFHLTGERRLFIGAGVGFLGIAIGDVGWLMMLRRLKRPLPIRFGGPPQIERAVFLAMPAILSGILIATGPFWLPK